MKRMPILLALILMFSSLHSCSHLPSEAPSKWGQSQKYGRLILFINGPPHANFDLSFRIANVAVSSQGNWEDVPLSAQDINSADLIDHQMVLAEGNLPARTYDKIRLKFSQARLMKGQKRSDLAVSPEGLEGDFRFTVTANQDTTLFISWDVDGSVTDNLFSPAFNFRTEIRGVSSRLAYVTNEGSNNVTVINRDLDEVFSVIAVGHGPCGLAVNSNRTRLRVYVTNSLSGDLSVIDPSTNQVERSVPVRFGTRPRAVACGQAASGKEYLFVANYGSGNVSIIDADNYEELAQVRVGTGPAAMVTDPPIDTINNMRGLTSDQLNRWRSYRNQYLQVYVANSSANTVSVIVFNTSTLEVSNTYSITVGSSPMALDVDILRGKVYVANNASDAVFIINSLDVMDGNAASSVTTLTNLGTGGTGIAVDPFFARLYLLKNRPSELVFLQTPSDSLTGSLRSIMTPITGILKVGSNPRFLAMDPEGRKLYVTDSKEGKVHVIDKATRRLVKSIPTGDRPCEIKMIPF